MSDFKPNHRGVGNMLQAEWMEQAMVVFAEEIRGRAIALAPVGRERDGHPGRYKASFHVRSTRHGAAPGRFGMLRAEAVVYNDSPEAVFVEFGHHGREPYHVLAEAAFRRI